MLENIPDRKTVENQMCKLADYLLLNKIDHFHFDPSNMLKREDLPLCMQIFWDDLIKDHIEIGFNKAPRNGNKTYWNCMARLNNIIISINGKLLE